MFTAQRTCPPHLRVLRPTPLQNIASTLSASLLPSYCTSPRWNTMSYLAPASSVRSSCQHSRTRGKAWSCCFILEASHISERCTLILCLFILLSYLVVLARHLSCILAAALTLDNQQKRHIARAYEPHAFCKLEFGHRHHKMKMDQV